MQNIQNFLVSIIIPTKNSGEFLDACLKSIKNQTYKNIEIIVVDNNSSDKTFKIAKKYTPNVFNCGPERSAQRNFGAKKAKGECLLFLDADMILTPKVIEECVRVVEGGVIIPEKSFGISFWAQCKALERSFYVGVEYMEAARFYKKDIIEKLGGYDKNMISGEDWDLSQKVKQKYKIGRISEFILHNEGNLSLKKTLYKKYYYAKNFSDYLKKNANRTSSSQQISLFKRYELFFKKPKELFKNPILGLGMLFMKTCEFGIGGIAYLQIN